MHHAAKVQLPLLLCILLFITSPSQADDWGDWGNETKSAESIKRPFISGWWDWKYNQFSSFDQGRLTLDHDFAKGQKFVGGVSANYYQEDNNKKWKVFAGENYYKFKAGNFDFRFGTLLENIGSGDKISFVDKLNARRFHNGLANDYDRDKKEIPAFKMSWFANDKITLTTHYMPYFTPSEFPNIYSSWAYAIHKTLAKEILLNGAKYTAEDDSQFTNQFHIGLDSTFKKMELKFHYMYLKEKLPVISTKRVGYIEGTFPVEQTVAVNGNFTIGEDLLFRFETAYSWDKSYTAFKDGRIGKSFISDQYNFLLGTDKNLPRNFYINVQGIISYIPDLKTETPFQLHPTEFIGTFQMRQNFKKDKLQIEIGGINNFSTGEYVLTPKITLVQSDYLRFVVGYQLNGEASETLGPIGQFGENDTAYFETKVSF